MRVVIAEDSVLLREGLARLLADGGIETVGVTGDGPGLVTAVAEHDPDLAIVDVRMPPSHTDEGLRAALEVRSQRPGLPILVLSQYVEQQYATELIGGECRRSVTCSRNGSPTWRSSSTRYAGWRPGTVIDPEVIAQLLSRHRRDDPWTP